MVRKILSWLVILILIGLVALWVLGGGIQKIIGNASSFSLGNLLNASSTFASFQLPFSASVPQLIPTVPSDGGQNAPGAPNGANSPYSGVVVMAKGAARTQTASGQYLIISNAPGAPAVDIAGWTLQSPLSSARATIPEAASPFIMGQINQVGAVVLAPGAVAYIVTGISPVGVSFAENICTGYLGTLQPFVPPLTQSCPLPSSEIPDTPQNEARLGQNCLSYIASIPSCTFPSAPPSGLSSACVQEIQTKLSYSGCVAAHAGTSGFSTHAWRIYLAHGTPLWAAQHDVIRLLDSEGRVVSVVNY